jgi:hypothetical protein
LTAAFTHTGRHPAIRLITRRNCVQGGWKAEGGRPFSTDSVGKKGTGMHSFKRKALVCPTESLLNGTRGPRFDVARAARCYGCRDSGIGYIDGSAGGAPATPPIKPGAGDGKFRPKPWAGAAGRRGQSDPLANAQFVAMRPVDLAQERKTGAIVAALHAASTRKRPVRPGRC